MNELAKILRSPFPHDDVKFKVNNTTKSGKALMVAYVDARTVEDRLDEVFGVMGWSTTVKAVDYGQGARAETTLTVTYGGVTASKTDVGEPNTKGNSDWAKGAYSDGLKRVAVQLGIGRYLYSLPLTWVEYDPQKKRPKQTVEMDANGNILVDGRIKHRTAKKQPAKKVARKTKPEMVTEPQKKGMIESIERHLSGIEDKHHGGGSYDIPLEKTLVFGNINSFLDYCVNSITRYDDVFPVKGALKKLGYAKWKDVKGIQAEVIGELSLYAQLRDGGMDGGEAVDYIRNPPEVTQQQLIDTGEALGGEVVYD